MFQKSFHASARAQAVFDVADPQKFPPVTEKVTYDSGFGVRLLSRTYRPEPAGVLEALADFQGPEAEAEFAFVPGRPNGSVHLDGNLDGRSADRLCGQGECQLEPEFVPRKSNRRKSPAVHGHLHGHRAIDPGRAKTRQVESLAGIERPSQTHRGALEHPAMPVRLQSMPAWAG